MLIILHFFAGSIITFVCGLTLQDYTTRKPRITKWMTTTRDPRDADPEEAVPAPKKDQPFYRLKTSQGSTCILMTSDAIIEVSIKQSCAVVLPEVLRLIIT